MSDEHQSTPDGHSHRRWLRIAKWVFAVVPVLLVLGHLLWGKLAESRLRNELQRLASVGDPVTLEAIAPRVVSNALNGWIELSQAIALLPKSSDIERQLNDLTTEMEEDVRLPLRDNERDLLQKFVAERSSTREPIVRASTRPFIVTTQPVVPPLIMREMPELKGLRELCDTLKYDAQLHAEAGDLTPALENLSLIKTLARAASSEPTLIGSLVGVGCRSVAALQLTEIAPLLTLDWLSTTANRDAVEAMIRDLLEDGPIDREFVYGLKCERFGVLDSLDFLTGAMTTTRGPATPTPNTFARYLLRPLSSSAKLKLVKRQTRTIEIANEKNYPGFKRAYQPILKEIDKTRGSKIDILVNLLGQSMERVASVHYRCLTERRLAAVALAVRMYRLDHGDEWPASLDALVPEYLPAVPLDLMASGKRIQYRAGDRPVIWSVWEDGSDDGATPQPPRAARYVNGSIARFDLVVDLLTQPRPVPATQSSEEEDEP